VVLLKKYAHWPASRLVRQGKLGASCKVKDLVGQGIGELQKHISNLQKLLKEGIFAMENNNIIIILECQRKSGAIETKKMSPCEYFMDDGEEFYSYNDSIPKHNHGIEYIRNNRGIVKTTLFISDVKTAKKTIIEEIFLADRRSRIIFINEYRKNKRIYFELITDIVFKEKHPLKRRIIRIGNEDNDSKKIYLDSLITEHKTKTRRYDTSKDYKW
jgi:hypothetical protein